MQLGAITYDKSYLIKQQEESIINNLYAAYY